MSSENAPAERPTEATGIENISLRGALIQLDPLVPDDVPALLQAAHEGRDAYGYTFVPDDQEAMQEYVAAALADQASGWGVPFDIRDAGNNRVVGSTRFLDLQYWNGALSWPPGRPTQGELGFRLQPRSVARGSRSCLRGRV